MKKENLSFKKWFWKLQNAGLLVGAFIFANIAASLPLEFVGEMYWYALWILGCWIVYSIRFNCIRKHWNTLLPKYNDVDHFGVMTSKFVRKWTIIPMLINLTVIVISLWVAFK